jgi:hypothetical protein
MRAICPIHLVLFYLITHTLLGEQYKPLTFSLCNFLQLKLPSKIYNCYHLNITIQNLSTDGVNFVNA